MVNSGAGLETDGTLAPRSHLEAQCINSYTGGVRPAQPQAGQIRSGPVRRRIWQEVGWPGCPDGADQGP